MANKRNTILELHRQGKRQCDIVRLLGVRKDVISKAVKRFKELGHEGDRPGRGRRKCTINTPRNRQIIKKRVPRNSRVSLRTIARETGISDRSVRQMAKQELELKPYKIQKAQLLTDENKRVQLQRCRQLIHRAAGQQWERIVFTDEKLFTVEQAHNRQNDRSWSAEAPGTSAIIEHRQNPQSVMVWGGICASVKTPLVFVERGQKSTRTCTDATSSRPWYFRGPSSTLAMRNGRSSRIPLRPTGQKRLRSGAKPIFWVSSHLRNGRRTLRI
ncbi:uncharacterized protein LOC143022725 [Oratosquilla oratoria]|uniref:uncharacterized protein LOC143022725 n=1 Tax=Oratosquilla oratoria TaxID=337810 RepID=UPI003F75D6E2